MTIDSSDQVFQCCLRKLVDFLSRRDHSEKELRQKLQNREFDPALIDRAIHWASERGYLKPPQALSDMITQQLLLKAKGRLYILQYLKKRGLPPPIIFDNNTELHKAIEFARQKSKRSATLDRATREKIGRQLLTRGFPLEIVRKVIYEKLDSNEEL